MDIPWQLPGDKLTNPVLSYTDYKQIRLLTYIARYCSPGAPDFGHTCKHLGGSQAMKGQRAETSRCPTCSNTLSCERQGQARCGVMTACIVLRSTMHPFVVSAVKEAEGFTRGSPSSTKID